MPKITKNNFLTRFSIFGNEWEILASIATVALKKIMTLILFIFVINKTIAVLLNDITPVKTG